MTDTTDKIRGQNPMSGTTASECIGGGCFNFSLLMTIVSCLIALYIIPRLLSAAGRRHHSDEGRYASRVHRLPPGPRGLPFLGSLLDFRSDVFEKLADLAKLHGPIVYLQIGKTRIVVLSSTDLIKEAFQRNAANCSHRPQAMINATQHTRGIVATQPGPLHRQNRSHLWNGFRLLGLGDSTFSNHLHKHIDRFNSKLQQSTGRPIPMNSETYALIMKIFADLALGKVPHQDPMEEDNDRLMKLLDKTLTSNPIMVLVGRYIPSWLKSLLTNWIDMSINIADVMVSMKNHVREHRKDFAGKLTNLLDAFLYWERGGWRRSEGEDEEEVQDGDGLEERTAGRTDASDPVDEAENTENFAGILTDVFQAGCMSVVALLNWTLLNLALHPDVQTKIHKEIESTVKDSNQRPSALEKSKSFPYTMATILETLRLFPPAPLGAPHCAVRDTTIGGFHIPRDTILLSNIMLAQRDPRKWDDPLVFRPDRYIDESGGLTSTEIMGFSVGPRNCPGKLLSLTLVRSVLVDVLQDFSLRLPDSWAPKRHLGESSIIYTPKPFSLVVEIRQCHE
ncbi:cytochrome P450 2D6-like [Diadema setosum]|uniref:cytochrome P450 2D6-like n=1 Tax=Diadema setosum TaxID=31175 RepID=UPI003B3ABE3D